MKGSAKKSHGSRLPTEIDKIVGANVRKLRTARRLSLHDLASQIGISHQQLQKYETGTNRLSAGMVPVVAEALGVGLLDLYGHSLASTPEGTGDAYHLRSECIMWVRRTRSQEMLTIMARVLKALTT